MYTIFHEMQDAIIKAAMPYPEGRFAGRGIVICAGGTRLFTCAWVCISLLRSTVGCKLPIQVWYLGPEEMDARMRGRAGDRSRQYALGTEKGAHRRSLSVCEWPRPGTRRSRRPCLVIRATVEPTSMCTVSVPIDSEITVNSGTHCAR
jgi:Mannosyltransferase putative